MSFLRQSTQVVKKIGPYLDATDGVTEEVGLAGGGTEISKEPGAAFGTGPTLGTHDAEGWYPVTLTTTHTDTVGLLIIKGQAAATHLPVWHEFTVVEEAVYDAMYAASAVGPLLANDDGTNLVEAGGDGDHLTAIPATVDWLEGGRLDLIQDIIAVDVAGIDGAAMRGTDSALTDKAGFSLASTGLDLVLKTATGAVAIAAAVWDRVLTGATHNIATSAGRRLRGIQENGSVYQGQVWVDTLNGTAGTVNYENGTSDNTVDTFADAITLADSIGLADFHIINGSSITFVSEQVNHSFFGDHWTLALGGVDCSGLYVQGATVSGIGTTSAQEMQFEGCDIGTSSMQQAHFDKCGFTATLTMTTADDYEFHGCYNKTATAAIFTKTAGQTITAEWVDWSGSITLSGIESGDAYILAGTEIGDVILNGANGTVEVRGIYKSITDNRTGSPVLTITGAVKAADVAATLLDTTEIGTAGAGLTDLGGMSTGMKAEVNVEADTALTDYAGPTKAEMDAAHGLLATEAKQDLIDTEVDKVVVATITNAAGVDISADIAALNDLSAADVLTTALTEAYSTDGSTATLSQLLYMIYGMVGEFAVSGTTMTVKGLDGSTSKMTFTLDSATEPSSITRAS